MFEEFNRLVNIWDGQFSSAQIGVGQAPGDIRQGILWDNLYGLVEVGDGLLVLSQVKEGETPGVVDFGVLRVEPEPSVQVLDSFGERGQISHGEISLAQLAVGDAPDNESLGGIGVATELLDRST